MVKETAGLGVQGCNRRHIFRAQFKIKHADIFQHSFFAGRLGQGDNTPLDNPAENDLSHAFVVFRGDEKQGFILEYIVLSLCKRRPGFNHHAVFLQEFLRINLLLERVDFDLIDRRRDLVMNHQVHDAIRLKVGNPDRSDFALLVQFLHRAPLTIHIAEGLMNQIQVNVIQLQALQGIFKGFSCALVALALNPKFGRDEQFFSGHAAAFDAFANRFFVHVRSGRIDVGIANFNRIDHASFAFGWIGDLKNAEAKNGDFNAIVQFYSLHFLSPVFANPYSGITSFKQRMAFNVLG